jgi:peptidoglycan/xylan/chitin deacetylase (PgdA/CDA1 family)
MIGFSSCKKDKSELLGPGIILTIDKNPDTWKHLQVYMKEHGVKLTFYIEYYNTLADSTKESMKSFMADGHEMAHHSLTHAHADEYAKSFGVNAYIKDEIEPVTLAMQQDGFNPITFAYPHGDCTTELDIELLKHFKNIRKIIAPYFLKQLCDLEQIYFRQKGVRVFYAAGLDARYGHSEAEIMRALEKAKSSRKTISLYCHYLSKDGKPLEASNSHLNEALFKKIVEKANALGLRFYTASDLSL